MLRWFFIEIFFFSISLLYVHNVDSIRQVITEKKTLFLFESVLSIQV